MSWNWQLPDWPRFHWDASKLGRAEKLFTKETGVIVGASKHLSSNDQQSLIIELMSHEAIDTSEIEGEYLNRDSVQSSIRRALGLSADPVKSTAAEKGIAEMIVNMYQTMSEPLKESLLLNWHAMTMKGHPDLNIGSYRIHKEAMQIVSGPDYARTVHFEAPPSEQIPQEMARFMQWYAETKNKLSPITRAGIAHAWFESIHPFEDGNGRIGRAISEKILVEDTQHPSLIILAKTLLKRRKEYYSALATINKTLEITDWLLWFASAIIEAQQTTLSYIEFIIEKSKLMDRVRGQLNSRQEKVLLRLLREGPDGFIGGLSAAKYSSITQATPATITRDLQDLVSKGVLVRTGLRKSTRYHLALNLTPVKTVKIDDIL